MRIENFEDWRLKIVDKKKDAMRNVKLLINQNSKFSKSCLLKLKQSRYDKGQSPVTSYGSHFAIVEKADKPSGESGQAERRVELLQMFLEEL